jgi:diguanylate cyclase (GGDEF)-like protein
MFTMDPPTLRQTLKQLEQAQHDHDHWHEKLIGTLLCRLPIDPSDLQEEAHLRCRFGQWYYGVAHSELQEEPAFAAIEEEHRQLHEVAARLLREATGSAPIPPADYEELVAGSTRLRLELDSLRHEIQAALRSSDVLTGAYGRAELLPELHEWRGLVQRGIQQCCIAFMDLDRFKEINDSFGHRLGDEVLAGAVRCVAEHLRPYDKVFRYGGDEFLISLPTADLAIGESVTERIRQTLATTTFPAGTEGGRISTTASFGLALLDPDASVEESIDRADTALLMAKAEGRNRSFSWDPAIMTQRTQRRLKEGGGAG